MVNVERLEQLRRVVRDAPDDLFNLSRVRLPARRGVMLCAIGWARVDPWFRENTELRSAFRRLGPLMGLRRRRVAGVFGIGPGDARWLFETYTRGCRVGRPAKADFVTKLDKLIEANA